MPAQRASCQVNGAGRQIEGVAVPMEDGLPDRAASKQWIFRRGGQKLDLVPANFRLGRCDRRRPPGPWPGVVLPGRCPTSAPAAGPPRGSNRVPRGETESGRRRWRSSCRPARSVRPLRSKAGCRGPTRTGRTAARRAPPRPARRPASPSKHSVRDARRRIHGRISSVIWKGSHHSPPLQYRFSSELIHSGRRRWKIQSTMHTAATRASSVPSSQKRYHTRF